MEESKWHHHFLMGEDANGRLGQTKPSLRIVKSLLLQTKERLDNEISSFQFGCTPRLLTGLGR
jgi:hypothetical protein